MCSGPKCPCVRNSKNERIFSTTSNGYFRRQVQQQTPNSIPNNQNTTEIQQNEGTPASDRLTQIRQNLMKNRNQRKYTNKVKQREQNRDPKLKLSESLPQNLSQVRNDQQDLSACLAKKSSKQWILEEQMDRIHQAIQAIPLSKLNQLKFTVKPPVSVINSVNSLLSFFSGIDASVPVDLLQNDDIPWIKIQKYFEQPAQFINLLHSFEYLAKNNLMTEENIEQGKKWYKRALAGDEQEIEKSVAQNLLPVVNEFLNFFDQLNDDQPVQEEEEQLQEGQLQEQLELEEEEEENQLEAPQPRQNQIEQFDDPIRNKVQQQLRDFLKDSPQPENEDDSMEVQSQQSVKGEQPRVGTREQVGKASKAEVAKKVKGHQRQAEFHSAKQSQDFDSVNQSLRTQEKPKKKSVADESSKQSTAKKLGQNKEDSMLARQQNNNGMFSARGSQDPTPTKKNEFQAKKKYLMYTPTQQLSRQLNEEELNDIQRLKYEIEARYRMITQTQSQEKALEWSMRREARQKNEENENKQCRSQLQWYQEQKKRQETLQVQREKDLKNMQMENKEFLFSLSNRSNKKFPDTSFENQQYKQYLNQYASKYDESMCQEEERNAYIKSLQAELRMVDQRKNQLEQEFQEFQLRVKEYPAKSPFKDHQH